ncbi:hypothetical protein Syun_031923 [Stephania yunnanensis]|uniref:Uncharacterized protein n=1 Tax=Stephania yunnanensis TaxID=152371 RepID=A0AAP0DWG1_9MAGN
MKSGTDRSPSSAAPGLPYRSSGGLPSKRRLESRPTTSRRKRLTLLISKGGRYKPVRSGLMAEWGLLYLIGKMGPSETRQDRLMTRVTQGNFHWRAKHGTMLIEYASYVRATNLGYRKGIK